jgi:GMP synthase-like glutamine amidotransferase
MRALVIEHHELSLPGTLGERAEELGIALVPVVPSRGEPFPSLDGFDLVVALGAPWSVYGSPVQPWIEDELALLREAVDRAVPCLGICFGAQALAQALGGSVRPAPRPEVGWMAVESSDPELVPEGPWFQWHADSFTVPPGARLVARTEVAPQAFVLGPHLGVQFHPEITADLLGGWVAAGPHDLRSLGVDPEALLRETARREGEARARARRLFDRFLGGAGLLP